MKKLIIALALALPMLAAAQKIAHVNTEEIIPLMPEYKTMQAKLDSMSSQLEKELTTMNEEFQRKYTEFQAQEATMSDALKQVRGEELQEMYARIETFKQSAQQDVQKKQEEFFAPVRDRLNEAIKAVGKAQGLTYIVEQSSMRYVSDDALNVTAAVRKQLGI
ncbi:MAG: OmpH family outer membrane protein [Paludibacteraceae bacterium]|nr:OmpH family outer membrane protein [Paludibacteraceae bacterium]